MRICIVYDCLYPFTVGGAERWYRNLALRLAENGNDVTYLTMRQWDDGNDPELPGVRVVVVAPRMHLYAGGRRRIVPPLVFGCGVLWHLLRHGRRYNVVHTASFPYFSLLAAGAVRRFGRFRLVVDWHEVWTHEYWREYLGRFGGAIGWTIQKLCLRLRQRAFCFSRLYERRLQEAGLNGTVTVLTGQFEGQPVEGFGNAEPLLAFAGRLIPEKRPEAVVHAVSSARRAIPELRAVIFGDGPDRQRVLAAISARGLDGAVDAPGFVEADAVAETLGRALCLVLPSKREGYGLVVLEAMAAGVPVVVVAGPDNAAAEHVSNGENGFLVPNADADTIAAAVVSVRDAGNALRSSTLAWFVRNTEKLALESSLTTVSEAYEGGV